MSPLDLALKLSLKVVNEGCGSERQLCGVYCCDLLSIVMGRAKTDDAWITVMGNINTVAVALLSDVSCVVLSENMQLDTEALAKARVQEICVLASELPTFELSLKIHEELLALNK